MIRAGFLILLVAGCGVQLENKSLSGEDGGSSSSDAAATALTISTMGSAKPHPGDTVTLRAVVINTSYLAMEYTWSVGAPDGNELAFDSLSPSGDTIRFEATVAGTYWVECEATLEGSNEVISTGVSIQVEPVEGVTYTARILPEPSSDLPPSDVIVQAGSISKQGLIWQVASGKTLDLEVTDLPGKPIPSVVRLLRKGGDPLPRDLTLTSGLDEVTVAGTFDALFLPASQDVPPLLETGLDVAIMGSTWTVMLDMGYLVQGLVRLKDLSPLAGSTVSLRTPDSGIPVPSTIGTTGQEGTFAVRTREGSPVLTMVPPLQSGLPIAEVSDKSLEVTSDTTGWIFTYETPQPVILAGTLLRSDGITPAASARVVLSATFTGPVGTLKAADLDLPATGFYRRVLVTTSSGSLQEPTTKSSDLILPAGTYQIEAWPGVADQQAGEGYILSTQVLEGSTANLDLKLAPRVDLKGRIVDQGGHPLTAGLMARSDIGSFFEKTEADGSFQFQLHDKTSYSLIVRSIDRSLSTLVLPELSIAGSQDLGTLQLDPAVILSGRVTTEGGLGLAGALIRIWCSGADCSSHAIIDECRVMQDGAFELRVPQVTGQ